MATSSPYLRLFEQLCISLEKIGVDKTVDCLTAEVKKSFSDNIHSKFVLGIVAKTLNIPIKEILYGTGRKNSRAYAIGFVCYYLHYLFKYDMNDVKYMVNKNVWVCYKYSDKIKNLNPSHTADKDYLQYRNELDKEVSQFKITD